MNIRDYLDATGITQTKLADMIGVKPALVNQWLTGYRPVSAEKAVLLEKATHGAIRAEDVNDTVEWSVVRANRRKARVSVSG